MRGPERAREESRRGGLGGLVTGATGRWGGGMPERLNWERMEGLGLRLQHWSRRAYTEGKKGRGSAGGGLQGHLTPPPPVQRRRFQTGGGERERESPPSLFLAPETGSLPQSLFQPNQRRRHQRRRFCFCSCLPAAAAASSSTAPRFMEPWAGAGEHRRSGPSRAGRGKAGSGGKRHSDTGRAIPASPPAKKRAEARQKSPGPPVSQRPLRRGWSNGGGMFAPTAHRPWEDHRLKRRTGSLQENHRSSEERDFRPASGIAWIFEGHVTRRTSG